MATASAGGGRMQELLASYYGLQRGADRSTDVESTNFDAKTYVRGLLQKDKVETLLRKDDEMVSRWRAASLGLDGSGMKPTPWIDRIVRGGD